MTTARFQHLLILFLLLPLLYGFTDTQLANAIYKAENSTAHPYGIMQHYKHTTPRQACLNTIKRVRKEWDGRGDFIAYLAKIYAPIGASNDPKNLNVNWVKNVKYYLGKEVK